MGISDSEVPLRTSEYRFGNGIAVENAATQAEKRDCLHSQAVWFSPY